MRRSYSYYCLSIGGFALLVAAVFIAPRHPASLTILVPVLLVWTVWLLRGYWQWVRNLGR